MLVALRIKNFILIDELEIELAPGLNVLTGETGAGKSIVVGALNLVLGGRASAEQVRPSAAEAFVEALFDLREQPRLVAELEGQSVARGAELVVRRVIQSSGRSRAYINGRLCTAGELSGIAPELADVASQHDSVALTDPTTHIGYLDQFARVVDQKGELSAQVEKLEAIVKAIHEAREAERTRGEREAFLRFQLQTIDGVAPRLGEIDELNAERNRLRHAGRLHATTERVAQRLEEGEGALCDELGRLVSEMRDAAALDPALAGPAEALEGAWTALSEVGHDIARYAGRAEADPDRLAEVEERLYRLEGLLRQHGPALDDVIGARDRIASELAAFDGAEDRIAELDRERDALLEQAARTARRLSEKRKKAAEKLGAAISGELAELGMGGARVVVDVAPLGGDRSELAVDGARLGREGIDRVEFLISPNKGIDPRPLRKIASGGELSRALLALKRSLADSGPAGLYVFDEVDTGVGGAVADKIGRAIADVARHHQVLCITHLAPIAAFADAHFVVRKSTEDRVATTSVVRLDAKERIAEVARMLSGAKVTGTALKTATELIRAARGEA